MEILFICTGNTCRSAMAEKMLNQISASKQLDLVAHSAGTRATEGGAMSAPASKALTKLGFSAAIHSTRPIPNNITADLVLTATEEHKEFVLDQFPEIADRTFTIKEYAQLFQENKSDDINIADPYDSTDETYDQIAQEIHEAIEMIVESITR